MKRVKIFRVNSKITVPMNNYLLQTSNFKSGTDYSVCKSYRFLILLALVMASGVFRLNGQIDCGLTKDEKLTNKSTSQYALNYFEDKVLEIEGVLTIDQDTYFSNCTFKMLSGSSIEMNGFNLYINYCKFGCNNWVGITGSGFFQCENSYFEKFATAFDITGESIGIFIENNFVSNAGGIAINATNLNSTFFPLLLTGIYSNENQFTNCARGIKSVSCPLGIYDIGSTYTECLTGIFSETSNINVRGSEFINCNFGISGFQNTTINFIGDGSTINFLNTDNGIQAIRNSVANVTD